MGLTAAATEKGGGSGGDRSGLEVRGFRKVVPSAKSRVSFAGLGAPVVPLSPPSHTPLRNPNSPTQGPGWQQCRLVSRCSPISLANPRSLRREVIPGPIISESISVKMNPVRRGSSPLDQSRWPSGLQHLNPLQARHAQRPSVSLGNLNRSAVFITPRPCRHWNPTLTGRWLAQCHAATQGTQDTAVDQPHALPLKSPAGCRESLPQFDLSGRGGEQWQLPRWIWQRLLESISGRHIVTI